VELRLWEIEQRISKLRAAPVRRRAPRTRVRKKAI
jgi:hypothetical protein